MQIGILEPDRFSEVARAELAELGHVTFYEGGDMRDFLGPLNVLFVRLARPIGVDVLSMAPNLRYLCSPTTGHTHIDVDALAGRGVHLISLRGERAFLENIRSTPEHSFGLVLALLRRYAQVLPDVAKGGWDRDKFRGEELFGQKVGVIGLGRVGYRVASYCQAFGANISYCDPLDVVAEPSWAKCADVASLIGQARIVIMCASHVNGTPPILGQAETELFKDHYFVNTARGELVDEEGLIAALSEGRLVGLASDVLDGEIQGGNLSRWNDAMRGRNMILTPHVGGATSTAMARTEEFIVGKLRACMSKDGETA